MRMLPLAGRLMMLCFVCSVARAGPGDYFAVHVVDDATGRGVPLVQFQTTSRASFWTDSNGYIAFNEPGLMNEDVWFTVASAGYEMPHESYGFRGLTLKPVAGKEATVKVHRINIAERLYRETGQGIYRDTLLLGKTPPIEQGALNRQVTGQDSAYAVPYQGGLFWLWGDTSKIGHPLGNFRITAARVKLPEAGGLDPSVGVNFHYFPDPANGFTKQMCNIFTEPGPVWLDGLLVVKRDGRDQLMGRYVRTGKGMVTLDQGLVTYNDQKEVFELFKSFPLSERRMGLNHQIRVVSGGVEYFYGLSPFPWLRVPATSEGVTDPEAYESFTCLTDNDKQTVDRDASGKPVWKWRKQTQPLSREVFGELIKSGKIVREDCPFALTDVDSGKPIELHFSTVYWNDYRKRWVMIAGQNGGDTVLGEIWYAEANAPEGPWRAAKKIITHKKENDDMTFYNPVQHPYFAQQGGRIIFFEGTYTDTFTGHVRPTPFYDYNQIMYRLDLADPRLKLPEPPPGLSDAKPSPNGAS